MGQVYILAGRATGQMCWVASPVGVRLREHCLEQSHMAAAGHAARQMRTSLSSRRASTENSELLHFQPRPGGSEAGGPGPSLSAANRMEAVPVLGHGLQAEAEGASSIGALSPGPHSSPHPHGTHALQHRLL